MQVFAGIWLFGWALTLGVYLIEACTVTKQVQGIPNLARKRDIVATGAIMAAVFGILWPAGLWFFAKRRA